MRSRLKSDRSNLLQVSILSIVYLLSLSVSITHGKLSQDECSKLGYTDDLVCSSCTKLKQFDLTEMQDSCDECCEKDEEEEGVKKFFGAILEVCQWKLGRYPQVQAFIKSDKAKAFSNLKIQYKRGMDPTVKLLDENKSVQETLSVEKWDTDNIEEFFREKLL